MSDVIDLERMLAPLAGSEGGVGQDLRQDYSPSSLYQKLRDARSAARDEERAQDASDEAAAISPHWREVKRLAILCLTDQTRDLEIAALLTEALVRLDGVAGLRDSARLMTGLLERFWDHVFPLPDEEDRLQGEDGQASRAAPLESLSGSNGDGLLLQPLRRITLFGRTNGGPASLYLWNLSEEAAALTDPARRQARLAAGTPELSLLEREAAAARSSWVELRKDVEGAVEAWEAFSVQAASRFGGNAPSTRRVADVLQRLGDLALRFGGAPAAERPSPPPSQVATAIASPPQEAVSSPVRVTSPAAGASDAMSREQAIQRLDELARFFRRTEPHSPLSYALETLARRARMPFPALIEEVLSDKGARHAMLSMLGIHGVLPPAATVPSIQQEEIETAPLADAEESPKGIVW